VDLALKSNNSYRTLRHKVNMLHPLSHGILSNPCLNPIRFVKAAQWS